MTIWKSTAVTTDYVEASNSNKKNVLNFIKRANNGSVTALTFENAVLILNSISSYLVNQSINILSILQGNCTYGKKMPREIEYYNVRG